MHSERTAPDAGDQIVLHLPKVWREPVQITLPCEVRSGFRIVDEVRSRRGIQTQAQLAEWLKPNLAAEIEQISIPGLNDVVARIEQAITKRERIMIFGDYDCDGETSTAILVEGLRAASADPTAVTWMVPNREHGYGLQDAYLPEVIDADPQLLITVDCGSNDRGPITQLLAAGIDVVVIDHHQISNDVSDLVPVANPQRGDDANAQILVGAGLAWLVIRALAAQCALGPDGAAIAERSLDLAAIGTIGDVGLLQGVNRALVIAGAPAIRKAHRLGLKTLTRRMNLEPVSLNAESISMRLVPKLNGVGRIYTAALAVELLLETNWDAAEEQVRQMLAIDLDRKQAQQAIIDTISASLANGGAADQVLVLHDPAWKHGLVGAVASRMVNTVGRPLILLGGTGEMIGGSARSVAEWDIAQALQQVPDGLLERTGGHSKAAGLALRRDDLDAFRTAINAIFAESGLTVPIPDTINLDADIEDDGLSIPMLQELDRLGPYGNGNHRPMLRWQQVRISDLRAVGQDQTTANFFVSHGMHRQKVVMFRSFDLVASLADQTVDVVIQAQIDMFKGQKQLNAQVVDMHPSD